MNYVRPRYRSTRRTHRWTSSTSAWRTTAVGHRPSRASLRSTRRRRCRRRCRRPAAQWRRLTAAVDVADGRAPSRKCCRATRATRATSSTTEAAWNTAATPTRTRRRCPASGTFRHWWRPSEDSMASNRLITCWLKFLLLN